MFRKCFLHVGNPHAGSTSIQGALFEHAAVLRQNGFHYPSAGRNHGALAADKAPKSRRARAIMSARERADAEPDADLGEICRKFRADFEAEVAQSPAHTLLISSEFFVTLPADELQALGAYLGQFAEEVVVVCYVRHPYSEYLARIQHRVKRGLARLADFSHTGIQGNSLERLDKLVEAFGRDKVVFRPFERPQLYQSDAVADFLHVAGAPDELIGRIDAPELNVSPSHEAMMVADALIGIGVGRGGRGKAETSEMRLLGLLYSRVKGSKFGFDVASTEALLADARPQAEALRERYGLNLAEPSVPSPEARWSEESLGDLAELLWELASRELRTPRRPEPAERAERPARPARPGRGARAERPARPARGERAERAAAARDGSAEREDVPIGRRRRRRGDAQRKQTDSPADQE